MFTRLQIWVSILEVSAKVERVFFPCFTAAVSYGTKFHNLKRDGRRGCRAIGMRHGYVGLANSSKIGGNQVADYFDSDKLMMETSVSEYMSMVNTQ
jgi:hypothetical protein